MPDLEYRAKCSSFDSRWRIAAIVFEGGYRIEVSFNVLRGRVRAGDAVVMHVDQGSGTVTRVYAQPARMHLKILLPFGIFAEKAGVSRIVAETREGSFGLLPHRLDCVAALAPGILTYEIEAEGEVYAAVDEGVLVKTGLDVLVSVRNAIGGTDLGQLHAAVEKEFLNLNEREQSVRSVMAKMESDFISRLAEFHHE